VPPLGIQTRDVAEAIVRVNARHPDKPLIAVLMGREGLPAGLVELHEAQVPAYIFPESAARALGAMWRYREFTRRAPGHPVEFAADDAAVTAILDRTLAAGREKVSEPDALRILEAYGIPVASWRFVAGADAKALARDAAQTARALGFPVALKLVDPEITHKTDVGGVVLDLGDEEAIADAAREMLRGQKGQKGEGGRGLLVQAMAPRGRETIVGLTRMRGVGPLVMFGLGGVYVEVLRDVVLRLAPLLDTDASHMVRAVRTAKLLEGVRGEPKRDLAALEEVLLRVSQLAERHPRIVEMDINPLLALEHGTMAVDARVQLENPA
jgi:acyl-CoA synthetase (NDP forming)